DKNMLLRIIDNYFSLSDEERLVYRVGRRTEIYRSLNDLSDKGIYHKIKSMIDHYGVRDQEHLDKDLLKIMNRYIQ
ncbi:MAG TPA: radical SAM protein, partial [candidate division Zixibacteria bacterium]|nr:radical SAM protein [candidate division Zixibacteria bacterium]